MNTHGPIYGAEERHDERVATLSGLMGLLFVSPRVARSSQPWAERCNPFGIKRHGAAVSGIGFQTFPNLRYDFALSPVKAKVFSLPSLPFSLQPLAFSL